MSDTEGWLGAAIINNVNYILLSRYGKPQAGTPAIIFYWSAQFLLSMKVCPVYPRNLYNYFLYGHCMIEANQT